MQSLAATDPVEATDKASQIVSIFCSAYIRAQAKLNRRIFLESFDIQNFYLPITHLHKFLFL